MTEDLTGAIEKYGTGYVRLRNWLKEYPSLNISVDDKSKATRVVVIHTKKQIKVGEKVGEDLPKNQIKIIDFINKNNKITAKHLEKKIKISDRKIE